MAQIKVKSDKESILTAADGRGGRPKTFTMTRDKARQAVRGTITRAMAAISQVHPDLGLHLQNAIKSGYRYIYRPEKPVTWTF